MATRKAFALRLDPKVYAAITRWASDELRSVNGQIEYLLLAALRREGRAKESEEEDRAGEPSPDE